MEQRKGQSSVHYPFVPWIVAFFCAPMLFFIVWFALGLLDRGAGLQLSHGSRFLALGFFLSLVVGPIMAIIGAAIGLAALARQWTDEGQPGDPVAADRDRHRRRNHVDYQSLTASTRKPVTQVAMSDKYIWFMGVTAP